MAYVDYPGSSSSGIRAPAPSRTAPRHSGLESVPMPRNVRSFILLLLTFLPLLTLFHRNELGRWTTNRCVMSAPDEPAYLLMARSIAEGRGLSIAPQLADRQAFYPPGFPLILAGWSELFGDSIFSAHACVALLLCASVPLTFALVRRLLAPEPSPLGSPAPSLTRYASPLAALILTALYVANWHVLTTALYIFSEPAFIVITLGWLLLACRWRNWHQSALQTLPMALLAVAAYLIRSAGIVCIAATLAYPLLMALAERRRAASQNAPRPGLRPQLLSLAVTAALAIATVLTLRLISPSSSHSYAIQLLHGVTDGGRIPLSFSNFPHLLFHIAHSALLSFLDFACTLVPELRTEDLAHPTPGEFPRLTTHLVIAAVFLLLTLRGYLLRLRAWPRLPELYFGLYTVLFLLWPFHGFTRFWIPILPLALVYIALALRPAAGHVRRTSASWLASAALFLLLALFSQELYLQLPYRQRRLNWVSYCLASTAAEVHRLSPTAANTVVAVTGGDEELLFSWYLGFPARSPAPAARLVNGALRDERIEDFLLRLTQGPGSPPPVPARIFLVDYFAHGPHGENLVSEVFTNLHHDHPDLFPPFPPPSIQTPAANAATQPARWTLIQRDQREIITSLWELAPPERTTPAHPSRP